MAITTEQRDCAAHVRSAINNLNEAMAKADKLGLYVNLIDSRALEHRNPRFVADIEIRERIC